MREKKRALPFDAAFWDAEERDGARRAALTAALRTAFARDLTAPQRQALTLSLSGELTVCEVGRAMGISTSAAWRHLKKGTERLTRAAEDAARTVEAYERALAKEEKI